MPIGNVPAIYDIRIEFILFTLTLIGIALFHRHTMVIALIGAMSVLIIKWIFAPSFSLFHHLFGNGGIEGEWHILTNLIGLLFGFAILAEHFKESNIPDLLPKILPDDWKGGFCLLAIVCVLSFFLDNIAAAMIGGTIALVVFKNKIHLGYLAAIIAASNAGGAGSVVGDTTTTLMWIDGVSPLDVISAVIPAAVALLVFGVIASKQQDRFQQIQKDAPKNIYICWRKASVVSLILCMAIITAWLFDFPAIGVWAAILIGTMFTTTPWKELKNAWKGTIFLTALVFCASLMPVEELPKASPWTALALGFISAVFDNIPLTKLCLVRGDMIGVCWHLR